MKKIMKIAKKFNLKVVEDACMGIGGKIKGKSPGSFEIFLPLYAPTKLKRNG